MPRKPSAKAKGRTPEREPQFIDDTRSRNACFNKRKLAIEKKLMHLSVNTDTEIVMIARRITDSDKPPMIFSSHGDLSRMLHWLTHMDHEKRMSLLQTNRSVYTKYWSGDPPAVDDVTSDSLEITLPESNTTDESVVLLPSIELPLPQSPALAEFDLTNLAEVSQHVLHFATPDVNDVRE